MLKDKLRMIDGKHRGLLMSIKDRRSHTENQRKNINYGKIWELVRT